MADLRRRNADIAIRFQVEPEPVLVAHRLPDFVNSIYATRGYIAGHEFGGSDPSARWIAMGGVEVLAHWRRNSPYSGCKVGHIVSDMLAHAKAVRAGMGFGYLFCFLADEDPGLQRLDSAPEKSISTWILTHPDLNSTERVRVCARYLVDAIWKREDRIAGRPVSQTQ